MLVSRRLFIVLNLFPPLLLVRLRGRRSKSGDVCACACTCVCVCVVRRLLYSVPTDGVGSSDNLPVGLHYQQ